MAIDRLYRRLQAVAHRYGLVAAIPVTLPEPAFGFPVAISLAAPLAPSVLAPVAAQRAPTMLYYHHYRTVNALLDQAACLMASLLTQNGYAAWPIPASQTVDRRAQAALFPHKTAATAAGLGWIGRHALLVTTAYGPRVRLATILTDMPAPPSPATDPASRCGHCQTCVQACPAGAIKGGVWRAGVSRDDLVDAHRCLAYMRENFAQVGRGSVCGVCLAVCRPPQAKPPYITPTPPEN